jgi:hypothetical protein
MLLRLYNAATRPEGPEMDTLVAFMPDRKEGWGDGSRFWSSVRDLHGATPDKARDWALSLVEEIVEYEVRGHCWPPVRRNDGSHGQGWAFNSLFGAMWLQMLWLMLGNTRHCDWCGRVLDVDPQEDLRTTGDAGAGKTGSRKPPSHKRFCDDTGGGCRAKWNYHYGSGSSSKGACKKERDRRRGNF